MKRWLGLGGCMVAAACAATTSRQPAGGGGEGGTALGGSAGAPGIGGFGTGGDGVDCGCTEGPHNEVIYTLSQDGEIWTYDPSANSFSYDATLLCNGLGNPYSMAIDHTGLAWVMSASTNLIFTMDPADSSSCVSSAYTPYQTGFDLFGVAFVGAPQAGQCPQLYGHSFSGANAFSEGPGVGELVRIDPDSGALAVLSSIDFDGGELAGTFDGRLFAFAGVNPSKLIEYDRTTGALISTTPLTGLSKTNASAFAFFGGLAYFFTEAQSPDCVPCMQQNCDADYQACLADPVCAQHLQCAIDQSGIDDDCGGLMPQAMQNCVAITCVDECMVSPIAKVSQVTTLDVGGGSLTLANPAAPIRIVGAGNSICVPLTPR